MTDTPVTNNVEGSLFMLNDVSEVISSMPMSHETYIDLALTPGDLSEVAGLYHNYSKLKLLLPKELLRRAICQVTIYQYHPFLWLCCCCALGVQCSVKAIAGGDGMMG